VLRLLELSSSIILNKRCKPIIPLAPLEISLSLNNCTCSLGVLAPDDKCIFLSGCLLSFVPNGAFTLPGVCGYFSFV